jgi:hypothetical protein
MFEEIDMITFNANGRHKRYGKDKVYVYTAQKNGGLSVANAKQTFHRP